MESDESCGIALPHCLAEGDAPRLGQTDTTVAGGVEMDVVIIPSQPPSCRQLPLKGKR